MGIAPLVTAVQGKPLHWAFGVPDAPSRSVVVADGGTGGPIGLMVELFLGGAWVDVSDFVQYRDGTTKIPISRGRSNETSQVSPTSATVVFQNRDGRFSPRNPTGPYYGLLTRNTPMRISRLANGIRRYRAYVEVPTWPRSSDISGNDVIVTVPAAGLLRRIRQGNKKAGSALRRAYTVPSSQQVLSSAPLPLVAYWPCEDGQHSTSIASGLATGAAMVLAGTPSFAQSSNFFASDALPLLSHSSWIGVVPTYTGGVDNVVNFLLSVPSGGSVNNAVVLRTLTAGAVARLDVQYLTAGSGSLELIGYNSSGTTLFTSSTITGINGAPQFVSVILQQSGADIVWQMQTTATSSLSAGTGFTNGTLSSSSVGNVTQVVVNPAVTIDDTAVGHVAVQSNATTAMLGGVAVYAWQDDVPDASDPGNFIVSRFSRLCAEQNIPAVVVGSPNGWDDLGATPAARMGPQLVDTFGNLLQQPVDLSLGLLYESRDQLALALRTRASLYNQAAKLTLDYSLNQLSGPLVPVDDDTYTRNDVVAQRIGGSSYTAQLTSGALSMADPPSGAGDYDTSYDLSLLADDGLADHAGWRLHMGTVDEPRFPQVMLNLRHETFTSSVDMMNAALTLDIGDRVVIKHPPQPDMAPDDISLIVQGVNEVLGTFEHDMVLTCSPESPYRIGILDDAVLGHLDTDGSTLAASYPLGTETTLLVATTGAATGSPLWTTSAGDFPFDIRVGGEQITVTNITGSSSPQTFTVTRSVNGVVKAQTFGTDVRLQQPLILSL